MRRSEPKRSTKPLKRTPIKRSLPKDHGEAAAFREAVLERARHRCEVGPRLMAATMIKLDEKDREAVYKAARECRGIATQAHHRQPRGMGGHGSNDPENGLAACSPCHEWVERNRRLGYALDLLRKH